MSMRRGHTKWRHNDRSSSQHSLKEGGTKPATSSQEIAMPIVQPRPRRIRANPFVPSNLQLHDPVRPRYEDNADRVYVSRAARSRRGSKTPIEKESNTRVDKGPHIGRTEKPSSKSRLEHSSKRRLSRPSTRRDRHASIDGNSSQQQDNNEWKIEYPNSRMKSRSRKSIYSHANRLTSAVSQESSIEDHDHRELKLRSQRRTIRSPDISQLKDSVRTESVVTHGTPELSSILDPRLRRRAQSRSVNPIGKKKLTEVAHEHFSMGGRRKSVRKSGIAVTDTMNEAVPEAVHNRTKRSSIRTVIDSEGIVRRRSPDLGEVTIAASAFVQTKNTTRLLRRSSLTGLPGSVPNIKQATELSDKRSNGARKAQHRKDVERIGSHMFDLPWAYLFFDIVALAPPNEKAGIFGKLIQMPMFVQPDDALMNWLRGTFPTQPVSPNGKLEVPDDVYDRLTGVNEMHAMEAVKIVLNGADGSDPYQCLTVLGWFGSANRLRAILASADIHDLEDFSAAFRKYPPAKEYHHGIFLTTIKALILEKRQTYTGRSRNRHDLAESEKNTILDNLDHVMRKSPEGLHKICARIIRLAGDSTPSRSKPDAIMFERLAATLYWFPTEANQQRLMLHHQSHLKYRRLADAPDSRLLLVSPTNQPSGLDSRRSQEEGGAMRAKGTEEGNPLIVMRGTMQNDIVSTPHWEIRYRLEYEMSEIPT